MTLQLKQRRPAPTVRCWLDEPRPHPTTGVPYGTPRTDLERRVIHHSPDGHNWGYGGSGPADLALDILTHVFPPGCDGREPEKCWKGSTSQTAWALHQHLKRDLIATLPAEGGIITGKQIDSWIDFVGSDLLRGDLFPAAGREPGNEPYESGV